MYEAKLAKLREVYPWARADLLELRALCEVLRDELDVKHGFTARDTHDPTPNYTRDRMRGVQGD